MAEGTRLLTGSGEIPTLGSSPRPPTIRGANSIGRVTGFYPVGSEFESQASHQISLGV